ncbi:MAG: MerR family transcriptional regulator [Coprobacillaceae bacterium]
MEYTIKEVTKEYLITASTLRYYEKEGLLPKIKKNTSGQRVYNKKDLEWLDIITCMRKTGMGIAYIKKYIELCHQGDDTILERYQIFLDQREIIKTQLAVLEKNLDTVDYKIDLYKREMNKHKNPMNPIGK